MSFLEGVEGTRFPLLPRRFWCVRGRSPGWVQGLAGGRRRGEGLRAFARAASAPCRSLPALAPVRCSLVASLPAVPGLWNSCVCKLPREGRGYALVRRAHGPRKSSETCQSLEVAAHWRQLPRVQVHGPPSESLWRLRAPLADPHSEALATSRNGWKEDECNCRRGGKGKMLVPSAPFLLSRRRDSLPGLWLGPACAGRVGGERGSSVPRGILSTTCSDGVHSAASYPWAGAVIPSWGWGGQGRIRMSALVYVKRGWLSRLQDLAF